MSLALRARLVRATVFTARRQCAHYTGLCSAEGADHGIGFLGIFRVSSVVAEGLELHLDAGKLSQLLDSDSPRCHVLPLGVIQVHVIIAQNCTPAALK